MTAPKKVYLIDTNIILRYLLDDHRAMSSKAAAVMEKFADDRLKAQIPAVVLVECVYVMDKFYKIQKEVIADTLSRLFAFKGIINHDKSELLEALMKYGQTNIDIVDCILAARSEANIVVLSFDEDFKKLKAFHETP